MEEPTKIIRIDNPQECRIIERLNRFVVKVEIKGNYHPAYINFALCIHVRFGFQIRMFSGKANVKIKQNLYFDQYIEGLCV